MDRYILANLDRAFNREIQFYFDSDYTIEEIEREVQRELRDMRSLGDWTTVPEVRHKPKLKILEVKTYDR